MPRSHTSSQRSDSIWPKAPALSAMQLAFLLAVALAIILGIYRAVDASRSRVAARSEKPALASANCPQAAATFDAQRAACLRRRWSAMRDMKPWPEAPQNAVLEECLRSPGGDVVVPFKTNSCSDPTTSARLQSARN